MDEWDKVLLASFSILALTLGGWFSYVNFMWVPQIKTNTEIMQNNFVQFLGAGGVTVIGEIHMDSIYVKVLHESDFLVYAQESGVAYFSDYGGRWCYAFVEGIWYAYELTPNEWLNG